MIVSQQQPVAMSEKLRSNGSELGHCRFVAHIFRLFGVASVASDEPYARRIDVEVTRHRLQQPRRCAVTVILQPDADVCAQLGISKESVACENSVDFRRCNGQATGSLRTFRPYDILVGAQGQPVLTDECERGAWWWIDRAGHGYLLVGTDLATDLLSRQGDPEVSLAAGNPGRWGFNFERPDYLFERFAPDAADFERLADNWCATAVDTLEESAGVTRLPMLPDNAPGAIIVTGDDDQAAISAYETQLEALRGIPVTYFMHPQTKLDPASVQSLFGSRNKVELGLHPDALGAPQQYRKILPEQANWFEQQFGFRANCVRNHGFLNDGYWGHARAWIGAGLTFSSNLPGLNGRILNGSLIPGRLMLDDELTEHWSILTAFGDGMLFALGMTDAQASARVLQMADDIVSSGAPGVIVINLHPENAANAPALHAAMHDVGERGFIYWTMGQCLDWFQSRDNPDGPSWYRKAVRWFDKRLARFRERGATIHAPARRAAFGKTR